jgi:hypothetical protein
VSKKEEDMCQSPNAEEVADVMYQMVAEQSERKMKPLELTRAMLKKYGKEHCSRSLCTEALRLLVSPNRCVYYSGNYIGDCYLMLASG